MAQPPYTPVFDLADGIGRAWSTRFKEFTIDNYLWLTEDALYLRAYLSSLWIALVSTVLVARSSATRSPTAWRGRRRRGSRRW